MSQNLEKWLIWNLKADDYFDVTRFVLSHTQVITGSVQVTHYVLVLDLCTVLTLTSLGIQQSDWRRTEIDSTNDRGLFVGSMAV